MSKHRRKKQERSKQQRMFKPLRNGKNKQNLQQVNFAILTKLDI